MDPTPAPTSSLAEGNDAFESSAYSDGFFVFIVIWVAWCCFIVMLTVGVYTVGSCVLFVIWDFIHRARIYQLVCQCCCGHIVDTRPGRELAGLVPSKKYGATRSFQAQERAEEGDRDASCVICLSDMEPDEDVKELRCRHCYHSDCLDPWLMVSNLCPLCKKPVIAPRARRKRCAGSSSAASAETEEDVEEGQRSEDEEQRRIEFEMTGTGTTETLGGSRESEQGGEAEEDEAAETRETQMAGTLRQT